MLVLAHEKINTKQTLHHRIHDITLTLSWMFLSKSCLNRHQCSAFLDVFFELFDAHGAINKLVL